ncbi:MAG: hypothetical protein HOO95_02195 [Gallionella sp.]|nr:hypothetical protein [Gallionella sp.]
MAKLQEVRIAVGSSIGRRSTVWKFSVQNNEIYIFSRMFGSDAKVSLHSTGDCQWSGTSNWVKKVSSRKNTDRHFIKWVMPRPNGSVASLVFQIRIPETELRASNLTENLSKIKWLPIPPKGHTLSLECYITPQSQSDPALSSNLPIPHLLSLPLTDGRWFTVLSHVPPLDGDNLEPLRNQMNEEARAAGIEPKPEHRGCAFTVSNGITRGLIELCTINDCD